VSLGCWSLSSLFSLWHTDSNIRNICRKCCVPSYHSM